MQQVKDIFMVFTNKLLFIEWILQLLRAISIYFLNIKARIEVDHYSSTNETIDMRTAPPIIKNGIIYNKDILDLRWNLWLGCEFLTESNSCKKCGCFMKVKHKLAMASCPIGKWNKFNNKRELNGNTITS